MTFTEREKWIYFMTVMHTSQLAKQTTMKVRQAIEMYVRTKICPNISMNEWLDIEKDIVKYRFEIQEAMSLGIFGSLGEGKISKEDKELFESMENLIKDDKELLIKLVDKYSSKNLKHFEDAYNLVIKSRKDLEDKNF